MSDKLARSKVSITIHTHSWRGVGRLKEEKVKTQRRRRKDRSSYSQTFGRVMGSRLFSRLYTRQRRQ